MKQISITTKFQNRIQIKQISLPKANSVFCNLNFSIIQTLREGEINITFSKIQIPHQIKHLRITIVHVQESCRRGNHK